MKLLGYFACFLAGILLTSGIYEVSGMVASMSAISAGPVPTDPIARARLARSTGHAASRKSPSTTLALAGREGIAAPIVSPELAEKISTLSPEEKAAIKERRMARKRGHRHTRPTTPGGGPEVPGAPSLPGETLDTGKPVVSP